MIYYEGEGSERGVIFRLEKEAIRILNGQKPRFRQIGIGDTIVTTTVYIGEDGKEHKKTEKEVKYKNMFTCDELLLDCYLNRDKSSGQYHKLVKERKKQGRGVKIVATKDSYRDTTVTETCLDKLNPKNLMFFVLYNAPDYYDIKLGLKTYLDEIATYLVTYGLDQDNYKKYGKFVSIKKKKVKNGENEEEKYHIELELYIEREYVKTFETKEIQEVYDYLAEEYSNIKGNFIFNSAKDFITVKRLAKEVTSSKQFKDAMKEMVNECLEDKDVKVQEYYKKLDDIYLEAIAENDLKTRLECLRLGGRWLGMENYTVNTSQNHIIKGLEAANAEEGIDISDDEFVI